MMKSIHLLFVVLVIFSFGLSPLQEVKTKVTVYDDIFLTESGLIPLPENAIELELEFTIRSVRFRSPIKLATDREGNIYASAKSNGAVYKLDSAGELQLQIGKSGKGKGRLQSPYDLLAAEDYLVIHDAEKRRLEFMDFQGTRRKSRKISDFTDIVSDPGNRLYVAHHVQDKGSPLVTVYFPEGKRSAFGKPLSFHHSIQALNSRSLALNKKGEVYVAFTYFPVVRKYSSGGILMDEYRIESPAMKVKENYNLKKVGESIAHAARRVGYRAVIIDIEIFDDRIYLLSHVPRLEITEMDDEGNRTATYWMDSQEVYEANDLMICEVDGEKKFYISHSFSPKYEIDVFRKKAKKAEQGLKGEIAELTAVIAASPDYFPAYNDRGIARYRSGDYHGAIEDFSRAIDLAPDSALSYNNRGLSKVKTGNFDGAVSDFSKAVDLDPGNATVFFNRGIALAHKGDFKRAIKDFEMAANLDHKMQMRSREQINYCLSQLKKDQTSFSG